MATWITHLRIAQIILEQMPCLDAEAFMVGNIAPDSGVPNADWSAFTPPSSVSHFDESYDRKSGAARYEAEHMRPEQIAGYDLQALSFHLGYICHLMTDALWRERIALPSQEKFRQLFEEEGGSAWWKLKKDWYDLDFLYLRQHPEFAAWRIYSGAKGFHNRYLDIFPAEAFELRRKYITGFYGEDRGDLDRDYPYLPKADMDAFVPGAAENIAPALLLLAQGDLSKK